MTLTVTQVSLQIVLFHAAYVISCIFKVSVLYHLIVTTTSGQLICQV